MVKVDEKERIRRAYFLGRKSIREIAKELHHSRNTVRKAIYDSGPPRYMRVAPTARPMLSPNKMYFCFFGMSGLTTPVAATADFAHIRLHGSSGLYASCYRDILMNSLRSGPGELLTSDKT